MLLTIGAIGVFWCLPGASSAFSDGDLLSDSEADAFSDGGGAEPLADEWRALRRARAVPGDGVHGRAAGAALPGRGAERRGG